jgi:dTDP-4-amino-4,6-dideoxygalactose transaminase
MNIKFNDLTKQWHEIKEEVMPELDSFFESSAYICGPYLERFEKQFSEWTGRKYSIGVSNGTDGLKLAIQSFNFYAGKTDVIMPANTFIADPFAVSHQVKGDYHITLIDHDDYYQMDLQLLEEYLSSNRERYDNCIVIPVHLYGHPTNMKKLNEITSKYNCKIIEDASQAHGAITNGEMVGKYADMTVYSLYPGKNLGAIGDAGIVTTDNEEYKNRLVSLRNYGSPQKYHHDDIGWNHRMDPIQAVILSAKLKHLDKWNRMKQPIAKKYNELLSDIVITPKIDNHVDLHVYHIYCIVVEDRENLQKFLSSKGIQNGIHYPIPIKDTPPYSYLANEKTPNTQYNSDKILSLPMHPWIQETEIEYVCSSIKQYYETN